MNDQLTDAQRKAVDTVEKLLRLAAGRGSAAEAASAAAKAQEILEAHNLSMAEVERAQGKVSGKREELKQRGGMFVYERRLWGQVAELNFCLHFVRHEQYFRKDLNRRAIRFVNALVGRTVNTAAARALGTYLQGTIERLCRERLHERGEGNAQFFSAWAVSFREGVADEICWRLYERRKQRMSDEEAARRAAAEKGMSGASTATALTLRDVATQEKDANRDFIMGEGWSARMAEKRARAAAAQAAAEAEYTKWAKANPEEARKQEAKQEKIRAQMPRGRAERQRRNKDWGAYKSGAEAGKHVSIDQQVDEGKIAGRIGHG
jgi:hypothetical protein